MPARDSDRIRAILLQIEGDKLKEFDAGWVWARGTEVFLESDTYQIALLQQAGFLDCTDISMANVVPDRLRFSFTGHDDLDAIRDEGIWNKTLNAVAETGGSATLEMVKALATGFLKKTLELHIGVSMSAQNGPCRAPQRGLADTLRQRSRPPKLQSHTSGN